MTSTTSEWPTQEDSEVLKAIVELINTGILPKGSTQSVMVKKWPPVNWR